MKKKISLKDYTKRAEALKMIEIDSAASEIYGEFEKYFVANHHAEKLSRMIVEAASDGKTSINFDSETLDKWYEGKELTYYSKHVVTNQRFLDSNILKKVATIKNNKMHLSYGKFLICKMAEQLPSSFDGKVTVICKLQAYCGELCVLRFDWGDENYCSNKIHIIDFLPFTGFFPELYDWDDLAENVVTICLLFFSACVVSVIVAFIFSMISAKVADIAFWVSFVLEIAINFIIKFKPKRNLIYEGNVFNN